MRHIIRLILNDLWFTEMICLFVWGENLSTAKRKAAAKSSGASRFLNYPRRNAEGWKRWLPSARLWGVGLLGAVVLAIVGFTVGYALTPIPEPNKEASGQTSVVYYKGGEDVIGTFKDQNRTVLKPDEISPNMAHAAQAAEDKTFYENRGISIKGIFRAAVGIATNDYAGGGSTITQQYVKNYYLTNEFTLTRKVKEMFIAIKLDQELSKDQIMANYLNTIYLGRRAYGVQVASETYFDKDAKDLTVEESAALAAMIQSPGAKDPADDPSRLQDRFDYVIANMVDLGYLSEEEADKVELPKFQKQKSDNERKGQTGYLMDAIRHELKNTVGLSDEQIDRGGLKIQTGIDKKMMDASVKAVEDLPKLKKGMHVGLSSVDPKTGEIRAVYGGKDYFKRMHNASTQDTAQAGSTFKPFTLVAGLENGFHLYDSFTGSPQTFQIPGGGTWTPKNYGGSSYGQVSLLKATQSSINTAYAQLNIDVGPDKTKDVAVRAGLPENTQGLDSNASNVLGTASPTTLQMAGAFSTFAAEGVYRQPHFVIEVKDSDGSETYKADTKGERRFDKNVMAETSYALRQVVEGGSGSYASSLGRPVAGKTGTSNDSKSAWFVGYTPQLATAVSIFRYDENGTPIDIGYWGGRSSITGGSYPVMAWTDYMQDAMKGMDVEKFPKRGKLPDVEKPKNKSGGSRSQPAPPRSSSNNNSGNSSRSQNQQKPKKKKKEEKPKETKAPKEEKPKDDKPKVESPKEDKPKDDKPKEEKPLEGNKPDKPKPDKPKPDKPNKGDDKPKSPDN